MALINSVYLTTDKKRNICVLLFNASEIKYYGNFEFFANAVDAHSISVKHQLLF